MNIRSGWRLVSAKLLVAGVAALPLAYVQLGAAGATAGADGAPPTFNKDVAPILNEKCVSCHRPGAIGPMALTSYEKVRPWARTIKARVTKGEMPPWSADRRFGEFKDDWSLSQQQIDVITAWVDGGALAGEGTAPAPPNLPEGGWRVFNGRPPDVILEMPMEFQVPAEGQVSVFRLWDKNPFKEDVFVEALQMQTTNPAVMHHNAFYGKKLPEGTTLKRGIGWKNGPELSFIPTYPDGSIVSVFAGSGGRLVGAAGLEPLKPGDRVPIESKVPLPTEEDDERLLFGLPGSDYTEFPEGSAKRIQASNALVWEVHYSPSGKPETVRERIGLWLAKKPNPREVRVIRNGREQHIIEGHEIGHASNLPPIPPGAADWKITAIQPFTEAARVVSMQPHMHLRGKDMTYVATYPDGREEVLLSVPRYDFNWQLTYIPSKPLHLPAGTVLKTVGHYDNSIRNRKNPQPNRPALWTEQTWDEMYNAWTELLYDQETTRVETTSARNARAQAAATKNPITVVVGCAVPGADPLRWTITTGDAGSRPEPSETRAARSFTFSRRNSAPDAANAQEGSDSFELIGVSDFVSPERSLANPIRKQLYPLERVNTTGALVAGQRVRVEGCLHPRESCPDQSDIGGDA